MCGLHRIFSNYWIRLSWIWKILQKEEGVIHHLQNSSYPTKAKFNNCFIIYSNYFQTLKGEHELFVFLLIKNNTTSSPGFLVNSSKICSRLHIWQHFDVIGSIICSGLLFWRHRFNITKFLVNYACGLIQSETGKYFKRIVCSFKRNLYS